MSTILYSSPGIPPEWIAAHGLTPSRLIPGHRSGRHPPGMGEGICPFMWQFINEARADLSTAGIVLATTCDQMRRAGDLLRKDFSTPIHLFHTPSTWRSGTSCELFAAELRRLSRFMESVGGRIPSRRKLAGVMQDYERTRQALHALRPRLAPRVHAEMLFTFYRTGRLEIAPGRMPVLREAIRVALVGGPLFHEDLELFDMVEEYGGHVELDGTETGERTFPAGFNLRRTGQDPLQELTRAYADSIPDAFRRPNTLLYEWLADGIRQRKVKGVILCRHLWCDIWHAELQRLRNRLSIPVVDLDFGDEPLTGRSRTRLQAFMESLQSKRSKRKRSTPQAGS